MTTTTANHLLLSTVWTCATGIWAGETAGWTLRFAVGGGGGAGNYSRPDLAAGQISLNTFDCHTDVTTRALTLSSVAGSLAQSWEGDGAPPEECVTDNDIDFFLTKGLDFSASVKTYIPSPYQLTHIKLYAVGVDGKSPLGPNTWTPTAAYAGGAGDYNSPETAACISLYSAHRQKTGRGRIYVGPLLRTCYDNAGNFNNTFVTTLRTAMKTLQDSVRTRGTPGSSACYVGIVWSRLDKTKGSVINKIRVGDEPDHQERRTKGRPEVFSDVDVA